MRARAGLAAAVLGASISAVAANEALTTLAERSQFRTTGRYSEVQQLCTAFEKAYPRAVRCVTFGRTPEGRAMVAIIASRMPSNPGRHPALFKEIRPCKPILAACGSSHSSPA